jgi:hypothetical protein
VDCTLSLLKAGCTHPSGGAGVDSDKTTIDQASFLHELIGSFYMKCCNGLASFMQHGGVATEDNRSVAGWLTDTCV